MREIKFRAYSHDLKKMYAYALPGFNGELWVHKNKIHNGEWENIGCGVINDKNEEIADYSYSLMQYTGLKDKNLKEIYEGDVVTYGTNPRNWDIRYMDEFAQFQICCLSHDKSWLAHYPIDGEGYKITIIGNIYENPELLNQ